MNTDTHSELRMLQDRAYGPAADIAQDPAALRRLRELESRRRVRRVPMSSDQATAFLTLDAASPEPERDAPVAEHRSPQAPPVRAERPATQGSPVVTEHAASQPPPVRAEHPAPQLDLPVAVATSPENAAASRGGARGTRASASLPRRLRLMWALSVVAAAAAAAGVTYGLTKIAPVSVSSGAPQIASLDPVPGLTVPAGWMGAGPSSAAWEFYGLTIFESDFWGAGAGGECFTIVHTEQLPSADVDVTSYSFSGTSYSGCREGSFPATASMSVNSSAPRPLREQYPDSVLQFVMDGDRIGVFLDAGQGTGD
ncbi:hypothetical protein [Microbacterium sp. Marseille-Q6965]|uniref:hypothetical protein n=1 Tax=Microbacterium sp. Marseille-Q6965 TaxID=2965072 RepID=UPI0021B80B01|nr:hypothetical protein [Microbacterium sp. Marseille-Q6965]